MARLVPVTQARRRVASAGTFADASDALRSAIMRTRRAMLTDLTALSAEGADKKKDDKENKR